MDKQPKFKAQRGTPMFADHRSMRPHIDGTVAHEDLEVRSELINDPVNPGLIGLAGGKDQIQISDPTTYAAVFLGRIRTAGMTDSEFDARTPPNANDAAVAGDTTFYVRKIPAQFPVSTEFLKRGQERFNIYCAPCHGESGYGNGPIAQRAMALQPLADAGTSGWVKPQDLQDPKILARPDGHIFNTITHGARTMPPYDKQISVPDRWAIIAYLRALQLSQNAPGAK
jgi:mono/diheme cytochrome c family protein